MHIEFREVIHSLLSEFVSLSKEHIEVIDAPADFDADVASPVCFKFSGKDALRGFATPNELCEELINIYGSSSLFRLTNGGSGYLNARLIAEEDMLRKIYELGAKSLLSPQSLFSEDGLGAVKKLPVNLNWLFDTAESKADPQELVYLERTRSRGVLSREEALQILAFVARPKMDLCSYYKGLKGRENLPWLMRRFEQDVESLSDDGSDKLERVLINWRSYMLKPCPHVALVRQVLQGIGEFYGIFNIPGGRANFGALARLLRDLVSESIEMLEFCCESGESVLGIEEVPS